jgi:hypothetical protein
MRRLEMSEETGWLIELFGPKWLALDGEFYTDPNLAIRFCRQTDAEAMICMLNIEKATATEHSWVELPEVERAVALIAELKNSSMMGLLIRLGVCDAGGSLSEGTLSKIRAGFKGQHHKPAKISLYKYTDERSYKLLAMSHESFTDDDMCAAALLTEQVLNGGDVRDLQTRLSHIRFHLTDVSPSPWLITAWPDVPCPECGSPCSEVEGRLFLERNNWVPVHWKCKDAWVAHSR